MWDRYVLVLSQEWQSFVHLYYFDEGVLEWPHQQENGVRSSVDYGTNTFDDHVFHEALRR